MDQAVSRAWWLMAGLLAGSGLVQAQNMVDPTQPPAALPGSAAAIVTAGPQLQSVLVARRAEGRRVAVIDGQTVREGEKFKGAVVSHVTDSEVVLLRGSERQVLKLFPMVKPSSGSADNNKER